MEENEIEERGISLGEIFRTIFSQKWIALIIAVLITIVGTIGLYFMGKQKTEYSMEFGMELPGTSESPSTYQYPDGKLFNYTDFVSVEYLKEVKATSSDFENIDVEKMVQKGDIKISRVLTETAEGSKEYAPSYKLSITAKWFKDSDNARDFMVAIAQGPVSYIATMNINYDYYITASRNALTYTDQLNALESQMSSLQSLYASFINSYGSNFQVEVDIAGVSTLVSLSKLKAESVDEYLNKDLFSTLRREVYDNGYVKSTDTRERDRYQSEWKAKDEQLTVAKNTLTKLLALQTSSGSTIIYADSIRAQIIEVEQLTIDLQHIQDRLDAFDNGGEVNSVFDAKVNAVEAEVIKFTEDIKPIAAYVYKNVSKVNIPEANKITEDGGFGLAMSAVISFVLAIVIACIVAYIVGWYKQKKSVEVKEKPVAEISVFTEAQAQAAATDETSVTKADSNEDSKK